MERISDLVFDLLKEAGVEHVFTLPGGAAMHLDDSLGKSGIPYTACAHEFSAGLAAMAYSQYTNKLGVCLVTNGPGAINAINACAAAWIDSAPVLFISGQCKSTDMVLDSGLRSRGQQEVDIIPLVNSITKYSQTILGPDEMVFLTRAIYRAMSPRKGPVWIEIPVDIQAKFVNRPANFFVSRSSNELRAEISGAKIILDALMESKRPIILIGHGVLDSGAGDVMDVVTDILNAPFMTTWRAAEFCDERHPLYVGRPGNVGQRAPNMILQKCDLLISIGARLDPEQVAYDFDGFAKHARKIVVDIDKLEADKYGCTSINANASDLLRSLLFLLQDKELSLLLPDWIGWLNNCSGIYEEFSDEAPLISPGFISNYSLLDVLSDLATNDDVIVPGSAGPCMYRFFQKWKVKLGQRILVSAGLQSMGSAIPMAMGAALASGKRVISIVGDGGFQMTAHTLATIINLDLNIKFFVLDNGGFNAIKGMQDYYFDHRYVATTKDSGLWIPKSTRIAEGYGMGRMTIAPGYGWQRQVEDALNWNGPIVCSVVSDIDEPVSPRVRSKIMPDGTMKSMGIENMWPFLNEDRLEELMK